MVAVIPKPWKPNYTTPKAYWSISLLAMLGKGLERVVSDRLSKHGEEGGFHPDHVGGRRGKPAEECVTDMIYRNERAREEGRKVTILASDIAQAFPSVPVAKLAKN